MILVPVLQDCHSVVKLYNASAPLSSLAMLSMYRFTDSLQALLPP